MFHLDNVSDREGKELDRRREVRSEYFHEQYSTLFLSLNEHIPTPWVALQEWVHILTPSDGWHCCKVGDLQSEGKLGNQLRELLQSSSITSCAMHYCLRGRIWDDAIFKRGFSTSNISPTSGRDAMLCDTI